MSEQKDREISGNKTTTVSNGGFQATITWDAPRGSLIELSPPTDLTQPALGAYGTFLTTNVAEKAQSFDIENQEHFLDLSEWGLEERNDLSPSLGHENIWVKRGTEKLEFGSLYLSWKTKNLYNQFTTNRTHGFWQLQVNGLEEEYLHGLKSRWDDEAEAEKLAKKVVEDEGNLILELSLTNTEEIQKYGKNWNRAHAAQDFVSHMTNAQHTPYTRVAKILKNALGSSHSRSRFYKTAVVPLSLPNKKTPAVLISYRDEAAATRGRQVLSQDFQEISDVHLPGSRGEKAQVWAMDASIFASPNDSNGMKEWLQHTAESESRNYYHDRKAYV